MIKYYLIPVYEIENLERERVKTHKTIEHLDNKSPSLFPVILETTWRITHKRWKTIKLWDIYEEKNRINKKIKRSK